MDSDIISQEDLEKKIIAFILEDPDNLRQLISKKITFNHFIYTPPGERNRYYRAIFKIVIGYFTKYQKIMAEETFLNEIERLGFDEPTINSLSQTYAEVLVTPTSSSNLEYLIDELRNRLIVYKTSELVYDIRSSFLEKKNISPQKALAVIKEKIIHIEAENTDIGSPSVIINVAGPAQQLISEYKSEKLQYQSRGGVRIGYPDIDNATDGFREGQLILFIGEAGKGKSTMLLNAGVNAHTMGKNVLFFSWEMPAWQCKARYYACQTGISYQDFKTYSLRDDDLKRWEKFLYEQEKNSQSYFVFVDQPDFCTLEEIDFQCRSLINTGNKPDLIIVDYLGNMRLLDGGREMKKYEAIGQISIKLRALARIYGIPFLTAQQVNREALKLNRKKQDNSEWQNVQWEIESIADAKATADYADAIFGLSPQIVLGSQGHSLMWIHKVKGRDFHFSTFSACYDPECSKVTPMSKAKDIQRYMTGGGDPSNIAKTFSSFADAVSDNPSLPSDFYDIDGEDNFNV